MYSKNVNSFIPKIINTINIINDFNNILNNQINISLIELITQKSPLMSLNINNLKTPIKDSPNEPTDESSSDNYLIEESEDFIIPNVPKKNILLEGKDKIEINLLNQLELLKNKNNLLKKRFEEMKKQNNELNQDFLNKIISKKILKNV